MVEDSGTDGDVSRVQCAAISAAWTAMLAEWAATD